MSIIKGLFMSLGNQKVIPFNKMTPELHNQISSGLAKLMMVAKASKAKLTKKQQDYIINQAKQVQEFEDRYITGIKDKSGNIIKKGKETTADLFDLKGQKMDPNKPIMGGQQTGMFDNIFNKMSKEMGKQPKIVRDESIKKNIAEATKKGDFTGIKNQVLRDPDIAREFALSKKFPFRRDINVRSGEEAIPLARAAKFDDEMKKLNISATPGKDATGTVGEFVNQMKKFNVSDKDIQMMLGSGRSSQVPYVMEQYGLSASDVVNLLKKGKPLIEGMYQGGRIGLKEGRIARILKSLKPFSSENKFSNQLEGILYGEMGLAEGLNLLSGSGGFGLFAEGGRIGYKDGPEKPGRRTFIKTAAGLMSLLPFGLGKISKVAAPVVAKATEISGPALAKLVETVMSAGKLISLKGKRVKEMLTKKKLGKVEVEESIEDGSYIIKKDGKEIYYKPGRMDETGGIEDDIIEVIEDRVKKAGGGIGYMLGE